MDNPTSKVEVVDLTTGGSSTAGGLHMPVETQRAQRAQRRRRRQSALAPRANANVRVKDEIHGVAEPCGKGIGLAIERLTTALTAVKHELVTGAQETEPGSAAAPASCPKRRKADSEQRDTTAAPAPKKQAAPKKRAAPPVKPKAVKKPSTKNPRGSATAPDKLRFTATHSISLSRDRTRAEWGGGLKHGDGGRIPREGVHAESDGGATAMCLEHEMSSGVHRACFRVNKCNGLVSVGVVRQSFQPEDTHLAVVPFTSNGTFWGHEQRPIDGGWASNAGAGWGWSSMCGQRIHFDPGPWEQSVCDYCPYEEGDEIGLELDLDKGTLTGFKKGAPLENDLMTLISAHQASGTKVTLVELVSPWDRETAGWTRVGVLFDRLDDVSPTGSWITGRVDGIAHQLMPLDGPLCWMVVSQLFSAPLPVRFTLCLYDVSYREQNASLLPVRFTLCLYDVSYMERNAFVGARRAGRLRQR